MEQKKLERASSLIIDIWNLYIETKDLCNYRKFNNTGNGANSKSASHRIRLFHDQFGWDTWKTKCQKVLYNSTEYQTFINQGKEVHGEHLIPVNLLAKYIYFWLKPNEATDIFNFLMMNSIVVGVSKNEEKNVLNRKRKIFNRKLAWSNHHPYFNYANGCPQNCDGEAIDMKEIKPFYRYKGLPIRIFSDDGAEIEIDNFTLKNHYKLAENNYAEIGNQIIDQINMRTNNS